MSTMIRRVSTVAAVATLVTLGATTAAGARGDLPRTHSFDSPAEGSAVFVQTDNPAGNAVDVFAARADGRLSLQETVPTGGLGGQTTGSVADRLSSQGSLTYDPQNQLLFAVNAGSDSLSVLSARGRELRVVQVVSSGGDFPVSVAVHGHLVYVLDAGGPGAVTGYRITGQHLVALAESTRDLGLTNSTPPFFLTSPGQLGFSPDGSQLIVTTKASTSSLDVFSVDPAGFLSTTPTVTADPGNVPFAFTFTPSGQLVVAEAAQSTLHTYALDGGGSLTSLSASVSDGESALCWIVLDGRYDYVANAGSNTISAYVVASDGTPSLLGTTGVVATTDAGPIDMAVSAGGNTLYVEAGAAGAVDEFHVNADGSLSDLGSVAGLGAGIEGIAAS